MMAPVRGPGSGSFRHGVDESPFGKTTHVQYMLSPRHTDVIPGSREWACAVLEWSDSDTVITGFQYVRSGRDLILFLGFILIVKSWDTCWFNSNNLQPLSLTTRIGSGFAPYRPSILIDFSFVSFISVPGDKSGPYLLLDRYHFLLGYCFYFQFSRRGVRLKARFEELHRSDRKSCRLRTRFDIPSGWSLAWIDKSI